jgi:gliding motility-associated-like protein
VISYIGNDFRVRAILKERGIIIPDSTQFIGALHDTSRDEIMYYDLKVLSDANFTKHAEIQHKFDSALTSNAKERSRRFISVSTKKISRTSNQLMNNKYIFAFKLQFTMRKTYLLLFFFYSALAFSQLETQNWYFGSYAGITFANSPPTALLNGSISTLEGSSTFSDNQGNLLFYTDGMFVYNKLHQQMPNGFGLLGNPSSAQSGVIVPKPGSQTEYYVFTVDAEGGPNGFRYSEVNILLDGGLGDVITSSKNTLLFAPSVEKVAAVAHANGVYYWVIAHGLYNNKYYAYLVDCNGINLPVTSNVGQVEGNPGWGCLASSSNGTKIASAMCNQGFELLDFNNQTGVISNPILLSNPGESYGVSFSPNNQILYGCKIQNGEIYQWNINAGSSSAIISSMQLIGTGQGAPGSYKGGAIQQGLDGKLYIPHCNQPYLSCINNPNQLGTGCNLQHFAINLQGQNAQLGLPPFVQSFFIPQTNIVSIETCDSVYFTIQPQIQGVDSIRWDFGDTISGIFNSSTANSPSHLYSDTGNYSVSLIKYIDCISDTTFYNFNLTSVGFDSTINIQICDSVYYWYGQAYNQSGSYQFNGSTLLGCDSLIILNLTLGPVNPTITNATACNQYTWEGQNYSSSGFYNTILQTINGCDSILELNLTINESYSSSIIETLCSGKQYILNGNIYSNPGIYNIQLQSLNGCDSTIELTLIQSPTPTKPDLTFFSPTCSDDFLEISANQNSGIIQWFGPSNFNSNSWVNFIAATVAESGIYSAYINLNGCISDTSDIDVQLQSTVNTIDLIMPNVITPNGDQINDYWDINETLLNCFEFELYILNRWGVLVFSGNNNDAKFNGKSNNGDLLNEGVYFYKIIIENESKQGFIQIIN